MQMQLGTISVNKRKFAEKNAQCEKREIHCHSIFFREINLEYVEFFSHNVEKY